MQIIVGLGNPGKEYAQTWHNVGWLALDEFKKTREFSDFVNNKKFKAEIAEEKQPGEKIILVKPQTFMNNSGQSIKTIFNFYKIKPESLWIIHDDIDLPLGKIRISHDASAAGHKGVQSIIDQLGTQEFIRFRIGIKSEDKQNIPTEDYVLQKINPNDKNIVDESIQKIISAIELTILQGVTEAMNEFN